MKKIKQIISGCFATLLLFWGTTACNSSSSNDDDEAGKMVALVTYEGFEKVNYEDGEGYVSTFTYYGQDNEVESSCRSTYDTRLPQSIAKGQRMVISYTFTGNNYSPYPAGTLNVMRYVLVPTVYLKDVSHDEAIATNAPMKLFYEGSKASIYRTGNYINLNIYMPNFPEREYSIVADETTLSSNMPDLYISTAEKGAGQGYTSKTLVSFDITSVWRNPVVTGVNVHINNTGGNEQKVFQFMKY